MAHGIGAIDLQGLDVGQSAPGGLPHDFARSSEQLFQTKEIAFWVSRGQIEQKPAIAAADVDFERGVRAFRSGAENLCFVEWAEVIWGIVEPCRTDTHEFFW